MFNGVKNTGEWDRYLNHMHSTHPIGVGIKPKGTVTEQEYELKNQKSVEREEIKSPLLRLSYFIGLIVCIYRLGRDGVGFLD